MGDDGRRPGPARPFYERINYERIKRGWTQLKLAEQSGVDRATIHRMRTAKPQVDTVFALAATLDIDRDEALELAGLVPGRAGGGQSEPPAALVEDPETEEMLARLPARRRAILEQFRDSERERVRRLQEQAEAEAAEAGKRFKELVRIEVEESE
ncbi:helix-turn-helix transcriptional regulator [Nonomuraea sp. NPDC049784]|uniref:helix-turn-helix transcriptional regulator n=1 Tax=Nonomuraea sp. NPDC049784 TaxID=3154361 RepID=UPI0033F0FA8C